MMDNKKITDNELQEEISKRGITKMFNDDTPSLLHKRKFDDFNKSNSYNDVLKSESILKNKIKENINQYNFNIIKHIFCIIMSTTISLYLITVIPFIGLIPIDSAIFFCSIFIFITLSINYNTRKILKYNRYINDIYSSINSKKIS
jgi:hypothetical protein